MNPFDYCSLAYTDQWLENDQRFCDTLSIANKNRKLERLDTLGEALTFYRVARNWPGRGIQRFQPLLKILDEISISKPSAVTDRTKVVTKVINELVVYANSELFSLATKVLWIWFKHPFIIYDGNAARSLGFQYPLTNDRAEDYYRKWEAAFKKAELDIKNACCRLPQQRSWLKHGHKITDNQLKALSGKPFFHQKVFDIFLWSREKRGIENNYIKL
jgi:hypothetical protein